MLNDAGNSLSIILYSIVLIRQTMVYGTRFLQRNTWPLKIEHDYIIFISHMYTMHS